MSDPMTTETCEKAREKTARDIGVTVDAKIVIALAPLVRMEAKVDGLCEKIDDLAGLFTRVGALEVWRGGLNGRAAALAEKEFEENKKYPHHREHDEAERLHQRAVAALATAELLATKAATAAADATKAADAVKTNAAPAKAASNWLPALPRWAVLGLAGFVLLILALIATDKQYERMKKPLPIPSLVGPGR